jgi:hypothetical protein
MGSDGTKDHGLLATVGLCLTMGALVAQPSLGRSNFAGDGHFNTSTSANINQRIR